MPHAFVRVPITNGLSDTVHSHNRYLQVASIDSFRAAEAPGETRIYLGKESLTIAMNVDDFVQLLLSTDKVSFGIAK